jgi:hypothetical protein
MGCTGFMRTIGRAWAARRQVGMRRALGRTSRVSGADVVMAGAGVAGQGRPMRREVLEGCQSASDAATCRWRGRLRRRARRGSQN